MEWAEQKERGAGGGFRPLLPASLGLEGGDGREEPAWCGGVLGSPGQPARSPGHCARGLGHLPPSSSRELTLQPFLCHTKMPCLVQPGG